MRQFYLVNKDGQRYQLINDFSKAFLWQPSGLGFGIDRSYRESDGFFFEMNKEVSQTAKAGILVFFGPDPYPEYKAFMDYITHSEDLKLAYCPKNNWYYVDIDIEYVEKSEIEENGTLQCSISMLPKTPMYLPNEMNINLSGDLGSSIKQYDYKYEMNLRMLMPLLPNDVKENYLGDTTSTLYDGMLVGNIIVNGETVTPQLGDYVNRSDAPTQYYYVYLNQYNTLRWGYFSSSNIAEIEAYSYKYSNTAVAGEIEFEIPAQMDSGLEITIYGAISSPVMEFYASGEKIGEIDLSSISVLAGDYVKYSSVPTSAGIYQSVSGVVDDITEQIGLNADYPSFFLLPPNQTIKAVLQADVLTGTSASIKVYEYFMSV